MNDHRNADAAPLLARSFFERSVYEVAPALIGCTIFTVINDIRVGGMIIETEAYREDDPFAHCYVDSNGQRTKADHPMCGSPGCLYFYYSGQLPCLNLVCEPQGVGSAVLIRALLPTTNPDAMYGRRTAWYNDTKRQLPTCLRDDKKRGKNLCNGPAVLSESLGISDSHAEQSLSIFDVPFEIRHPVKSIELVAGIRIGLAKQYERWKKSKDPRSELQSVDEFGAKKWRWGASEHKSFCRYSSFSHEWTPRRE